MGVDTEPLIGRLPGMDGGRSRNRDERVALGARITGHARLPGVPVVNDARVWGNLYLGQKTGGEFTEADEHSGTIRAEGAAIAIERIENAGAPNPERPAPDGAAGWQERPRTSHPGASNRP